MECSGTQEKIERLLKGEVDATIGSMPLLYRILRDFRADIRMAFPLGDTDEALAFAIRNDWPELVTIIDKGLASITPAERAALYRRWLPAVDRAGGRQSPPRIALTPEEELWLRAHPLIRIGYHPAWAPLEFTDKQGAFAGISADYLREAGNLLGIRFEVVQHSSWRETVKQIEARDVDLLPGMLKTPDRSAHLEFTQPYLSAPIVIYAGPDLPYVGDPAELNSEHVLVVDQYATAELLRRDYPEITLTTVKSAPDALWRLSRGEAKAFVGNLLTAGHYIGKLGLSNLKVVGQTPYSMDLSMAVRSDWPLLAGLLRKALDAIPEARRNAIYRDWISVRYVDGTPYSVLWKLLAGIAVAFLLILLWNRSLMSKVATRTAQFREELLRRRHSEERFRRLYEHAPLPYQSLDEQGRIVAVNQAFEETLGYGRDEVLGRPFTELMPPQVFDLFHETYKKFLASGQVHAGPRLLRKDGTMIHAELAGVVVHRPDGSFLQTHCVWADVTERKRAEQALRDQRDFLESLFNNVDYAVFVVDVTQSGEFRYVVTNQRHQEWTRLFPKEINGKTPQELIPHITPDVAELVSEKYQLCADTGDTIQYEELVPIKDKEIWWSTRLTPLKDQQGRVSRIIGTTSDITPRRLAERRLQEHQEQLEESVRVRTAELERQIAKRTQIEAELLTERDRAEAASNAKSVFLANMSHELRTPLNAILGYASLLQKQHNVSEKQLEGLGIIERGGRQLHTLINDILDIARIEAERLVLEPTPLGLERFLAGVVDIVRSRAESKGIELTLVMEPGVPAAVLVDEKRLRQILLNLLGNAVKFTAEGGVSLHISCCDKICETQECRLRFEVQDTGVGIPPNELERIFLPFEQVA